MYSSEITFNLEVYEQMKINNEMCSKNCPCLPSGKDSEWTGLTLADVGRCKTRTWDFTGTYKTYQECLKGEGAKTSTTPFQKYAKELIA